MPACTPSGRSVTARRPSRTVAAERRSAPVRSPVWISACTARREVCRLSALAPSAAYSVCIVSARACRCSAEGASTNAMYAPTATT